MKIQVEKLSPVEKKVTVEIEPAEVAKEIDRAYAALGRRVKLRGFRPGKAPRTVLERNFKDQVEADVVERLVQKSFEEATKEQQLDAVAAPRVQVGEGGVGRRPALLLHRPGRGEAGHRAQGLPRHHRDPEAGGGHRRRRRRRGGAAAPVLRRDDPGGGARRRRGGRLGGHRLPGQRRGQALRRRHRRGGAHPGEGRQLLRRRDGGAAGAQGRRGLRDRAALPGRLPRHGAGRQAREVRHHREVAAHPEDPAPRRRLREGGRHRGGGDPGRPSGTGSASTWGSGRSGASRPRSGTRW